jgi:FtsP/CotA-like multicopper oxidase with cupredoxin domain
MSLTSTNLHFHGLTIPPICHQDDVLKTSVQPGDPPFQYRIQIPANEPPGLYWYHPHIHGFSKAQVLGGASGALIIEGIERANRELAGLPERVLVIRDQDLLHPDAPPSKSEPVVPKMLIDRDGDSANNGTGFGKPAKDLSINFVPVPYPDYPPASIRMKPGERQLWRVLNASAITYLNLALLFKRAPQMLGIVAIDGVPINENGKQDNAIEWRDHLGVPPGARVRKLFFSEKLEDPNNPNSAVTFYITVDGQTPAPFDPAFTIPSIIVKQGDVEDWIIENRSTELHAFHIHQIHFLLVDWSGLPVNEPFLRDTINIPYFNGRMLQYPSVRLRMDFRDPNNIGTFPYHCHLLEHEDGGMMGLIRVEPADRLQIGSEKSSTK